MESFEKYSNAILSFFFLVVSTFSSSVKKILKLSFYIIKWMDGKILNVLLLYIWKTPK